MTRKQRSVLLRWIDIFVYSVTSGLFVVVFFPFIYNGVSDVLWYANKFVCKGFIISTYIITLLFLAFFVFKYIGLQLQHLVDLKTCSFYPSMVIASFVGLLVFIFLFHWCYGNTFDYALFWNAVTFVCVVTVYLLIILIANYSKSDLMAIPKLSDNSDGNNASSFMQWLQQENPIQNEKEDLFNFLSKAKRISKRMVDNPEADIAVIGPFGSGKTSLVNLVQLELKGQNNPRFVFVNINCWGFENAIKAEEYILEKMYITLNKSVDCFLLKRWSREYIQIFASGLSWFDSLIQALFYFHCQQNIFQQITNILCATNIQLVVVLEDIDRVNDDFDKSQIEALLWKLKEIKGVSLILSMNTYFLKKQKDTIWMH